MGPSRRRLGRSPERYLLYGAPGHCPKTINHYRDTFRSFDLFLLETRQAETTAVMTTPTLNAFALWLRTTATREWRGGAGIRGAMVDMRAFARRLFEEGHIDTLPKVPVNKLPQIFFPIHLWTGRPPKCSLTRVGFEREPAK